MPTYEYVCRDCDQHIEVVQSFSDDPLQTCGVCSGSLRKVFSAAGIIFKGSGYYVTDTRDERRSSSGAASSDVSGSSDSDKGSSDSGSSDSTSSDKGSSDSAASDKKPADKKSDKGAKSGSDGSGKSAVDKGSAAKSA